MNEDRKEKSIPIITFVIVEIILAAIAISLIFIFNKDDKIGNTEYDRQPSIAIEKLTSELPEQPSAVVNALERELANTVELNSDSFNMDTKAEIRQGTLKIHDFDRLEGYYFSAIVDIPSLRQSYQIYDHYPSENSPPNSTPPNVMHVLCLDNQSEIIYPDFQCKDNHSSDIRAGIASYYLKYFDFNYFSTFFENNSAKIYINPTEYTATNSEKDAYLEKTKEAIESLGISPALFTYEITIPSSLTYRIYD